MKWKETGISRPTIYLTWRDVRQLVEPGIGLGGLGRRYGLGSEEGKGLFPHSGNNNIRKLHLSFSLPNHESEEWTKIKIVLYSFEKPPHPINKLPELTMVPFLKVFTVHPFVTVTYLYTCCSIKGWSYFAPLKL